MHKTFFISGAPEPYIFDFDNGAAVLRNVEPAIPYDTFKDMPKGWTKPAKPEEGFYAYGKAWPAFIKRLNEIGQQMDDGKCPFQTLSLDSVTTLSDICMNYVLASDNHVGSPQIQHWGSQIQLLQAVFDQLTAWPIIKIVTAHIQRNTNEVTQIVEMLPLVTGKLAGKIGIYFDEVYFCNSAVDEKEKPFQRKWTLTTSSGGMVKQAKSRYGVPDRTETKWSAVKPYLTGALSVK